MILALGLLFWRSSLGNLASLDEFVVAVREQATVPVLARALLSEILAHLVFESHVLGRCSRCRGGLRVRRVTFFPRSLVDGLLEV